GPPIRRPQHHQGGRRTAQEAGPGQVAQRAITRQTQVGRVFDGGKISFSSRPMPSISTAILSPAPSSRALPAYMCSNTFSISFQPTLIPCAMPAPAPVPTAMTSPGDRVVTEVAVSIRRGILKMMFLVL